jgi:hypothetical protein
MPHRERALLSARGPGTGIRRRGIRGRSCVSRSVVFGYEVLRRVQPSMPIQAPEKSSRPWS